MRVGASVLVESISSPFTGYGYITAPRLCFLARDGRWEDKIGIQIKNAGGDKDLILRIVENKVSGSEPLQKVDRTWITLARNYMGF